MSYTQEQTIGPGHASPGSVIRKAGVGGRSRLALGAGSILALVALATLGGKSDVAAPTLRAEEPAAAQPVFDGHGKWSGYAR